MDIGKLLCANCAALLIFDFWWWAVYQFQSADCCAADPKSTPRAKVDQAVGHGHNFSSNVIACSSSPTLNIRARFFDGAQNTGVDHARFNRVLYI